MKRQTWLVLLLVLVFGAALGDCRRQATARLTLAVGGAPAELEVWEDLVQLFTGQTGIEVEMLRQPTDSDQRRQGLLIPLKSRQADPDVFLMDVVWLAQFAASDWLLPLDEADGAASIARVVELVDRHQGRLVALPVSVDAGLLYYRTDLLDKYGFAGPPATWSELVHMAQTVQQGERRTQPNFWGYVWQG